MPQARGCSSLGKSAVLLGPQLTALPPSDGPTELRTREAWAGPLRSRRGPLRPRRGAVLPPLSACNAGSTTASAAAPFNTQVIDAPPGRAACCNAGAAAARGALLLFIHGDTLLPHGFGAMLRAQLRSPEVAVAAFRLTLHPRLPALWLVEWATNRRSRRHGLPYGDQGLGMRRAVYEALGRFPEQPFLEDLHLVLEARRRGPGAVVTMGASVRSSSRRWEMRNGTEHLKSRPANPTEGLSLPQSQPPYHFSPTPILTRWEMHGVLGNSVRNQCVLLGYMCGVPLPRIAEWYYGTHGKKNY